MGTEELLLGAVAYDPKVVTIWDGFRQWLRRQGLEFDFILYSNYERQVEDLLAGRIDVAWNSPLAWVRARRLASASGRSARAVVMRDTDRDLSSVVVVRADSDIDSLADLRGRVVATGAVDSPQSTLIPLELLRHSGVDAVVRRYDVGVGLHGDHIGGERDAARALMAGEVDAACIIDGNNLTFTQEGTLAPGSSRIVGQTGPYDHCNMTATDRSPTSSVELFTRLLLGMDYGDAMVRPLLDLEGLTRWLPGRTDGYGQLERAVDAQDFYDGGGAITAREYLS
jgi:ABC-type phosphate/phosphonate transport system substrate-binding protein